MSDQAVQSAIGKDEIPEKCMHPQESVWLSHWTNTSHRSVNNTCNQLSLRHDSWEESQRTKLHKGQHFPMVNSFREKVSILPLKNRESSNHHEGDLSLQIGPTSGCDVSLGRTDNHLPSMLDWTPSKLESPSMDSQFEHGDFNLEQQAKSSKLLEISAPTKDEFLGSTSRTVPPEFNGRSTPTGSLIHWQDYTTQPSSSLLVHEKKMNTNAALLIHDPLTNDNQLKGFVGEQLQVMPNHYNVELFSNQTRPPEARLYRESSELLRIPSSFHDVETTRTCTTRNSVKEFSRGPSTFPQTTHHFLITKESDVNLPDGGQLFEESTISKFKGKSMGEFLRLAPDLGFNVKQGVELQSLDSSTENEGKENIENIQTSAVDLTNESSAETGTMDMNILKENYLSGVASSLSNKDIKGTQKSSTSQAAIASVREESGGRLPNIELPDINQELPVIPGVTDSVNDEVSVSRTHCMDVEYFLSHNEHPTSSKSITCGDAQLGLDPCSRWVKRLKSSGSCSFGLGSKSWTMGESFSHEKVNKLLSKILHRSKTSSEPKMNKSHGREQMLIDQTAELVRNAESSCGDSWMKCQEVTLSHAWIQRWCNKRAVSSKKAVVVCVPESSKSELDDFQMKQFPSIAAMALMGKATTGFRPCEFRRRGSFVFWNAK